MTCGWLSSAGIARRRGGQHEQHPARRRRRRRRHAAEPLAAHHRRAVRDPGHLAPGRIDLGLGRAPGSDSQTTRALRRDDRSAERFPQDVQELRGYLTGRTLVPGVDATPGKGTDVPLYILGSSLFVAHQAPTISQRLHSVELTARAAGLTPI